MESIFEFLRNNPSILLFAALAGGYALGKVKVKGFSLGATTSVLLVGIALGAVILGQNTHYDLGILKTVSFALFIFGIGYKVGPDFISGLKRGGMKYVSVGVFFSVVALVCAVILGRAFGLDKGYTAGMLGGALTQSAIIGTADSALNHLAGIKHGVEMHLQSDLAVAYAVTYIFGTAGLIVLLKILAGVSRIDMKKSAREAQKDLGQMQTPESIEAFQWNSIAAPRAFRLTNQELIGAGVLETDDKTLPERVSVEKIKRGDKIIEEFDSRTTFEKGDVVLLLGMTSDMLKAGEMIGTEVDDRELRRIVGELLNICFTNKELEGQTVQKIVDENSRGCFVRHILRQGHELPFGLDVKLYPGDTVQVIGEKKQVERLAQKIGYPERDSSVTDLVTVGIGIILGTLIGLISIPIDGIPLTLGVGGGVLISGLFFGWLRSLRPTWGTIPSSALWIFTDLGLNLFIACVGISAGPKAIQALQQAGVEILIAGMLLTTIPHVLTWLFGRYALKLNPVLLMGAMTGAGTCTAAMNSVKEDSDSAVPVIGYTVPYAIGNVLLTVWGALIIHLV